MSQITWSRSALAERCELVAGFAFPSAGFSDDPADIPLVKGSNVMPGGIAWHDGPWWPSRDTSARLDRFWLEEGDIVLAMDRPIVQGQLKLAWIRPGDPRALLVQRVARIRALEDTDSRFLRYALSGPSFHQHVQSITTGANVPHISGPDVLRFQFMCPPFDEQVRIGELLANYDALIAANDRRMALLEESVHLLYREWFERLRFPGHEWTSKSDGMPAGWERGQIADLATVVRGKSYRSQELRELGGKPFVNLKCFARGGGFRTEGLKRFEGEHRPDQVVRPGDIVVAVTDMTQQRAIVARPARIPDCVEDGAVFSMDAVKLDSRSQADAPFLYAFLRYSRFSEEVKHYANGANVLHLNPKHIEQYRVCVPPRSLREQFAENAEPYLAMQDSLLKQNAKLREAREYLLPRLMSGQLTA